jgi:hypothetical protein
MALTILTPEFHPEDHSYWIDGKRVRWSVTGILSAAFGGNPFWTADGREFGSALHRAIHYYEQRDLDFSSLDNRLKPRIGAYERFKADMQWNPDLIEQPLYRKSPLYAGTIDAAQLDRAVCDFKSGELLPIYALQLCFYAYMLPNPLMYERWSVRLKADGKYDLKTYGRQDMGADWNICQSILNVLNWRERNGV